MIRTTGCHLILYVNQHMKRFGEELERQILHSVPENCIQISKFEGVFIARECSDVLLEFDIVESCTDLGFIGNGKLRFGVQSALTYYQYLFSRYTYSIGTYSTAWSYVLDPYDEMLSRYRLMIDDEEFCT